MLYRASSARAGAAASCRDYRAGVPARRVRIRGRSLSDHSKPPHAFEPGADTTRCLASLRKDATGNSQCFPIATALLDRSRQRRQRTAWNGSLPGHRCSRADQGGTTYAQALDGAGKGRDLPLRCSTRVLPVLISTGARSGRLGRWLRAALRRGNRRRTANRKLREPSLIGDFTPADAPVELPCTRGATRTHGLASTSKR